MTTASKLDLRLFELGNHRFLSLGYYKDEIRIRIKQMLQLEDGIFTQDAFKATSLTYDQWTAMREKMDEITDQINFVKRNPQNRDQRTWTLGDKKFVDVYNFGKYDTPFVDLRHYYMSGAESERKPTRYGIALKATEWNALSRIAGHIDDVIKSLTDPRMKARLATDIISKYVATRIAEHAQIQCYGCSVSHPSQVQHMSGGGCLSPWNEVVDTFFDEIFNDLSDQKLTSIAAEIIRKMNVPALGDWNAVFSALRAEAVKESIRCAIGSETFEPDELWKEALDELVPGYVMAPK
jgi:hypothetical protein